MIEGQEHDEKVHTCLLYLIVCLLCLFTLPNWLFVYKFVHLYVYERLTYGVWVYSVMNFWLVNLHLKQKVTQKLTGVFRE
jgi:hypothetical protein